MRNQLFWLTVLAILSGALAPSLPAAEDTAAEDAREQAAIERFRTLLESNPRRGTALDRIYGYHVERGTLDDFIKEYQQRADKEASDGVAWMIVGLLESQRGRDAAAVTALGEAEKRLSQSAMPAYYLGQSLVLVGQPDAAAEAFERAITRKPNRADLLDIFQALGRVYQRGQRSEKALSVWTRLEQLFPDDARVQEQITSTLVEEGQHEQALPRIEKLAKQTEDPYRKSTLLLEAAEVKVRLKRTAEALTDFEGLLGQLNPESWLYRDVRRRIEEVFLRTDDMAGLAKYYEQWVEKHSNDIEAISRLAKALSSQGRLPEASTWLQRGIDVATNNKSLRQALIEQLTYENRTADAAKEYEALHKLDPTNPDVLRDWGKLVLRDNTRPEAERKAAAVAIWKRMLEKKPTDPVATAQVADLVRTAGLTDEAIALYQKAIELSPTSAQYREYLGEYLHNQKRSDEALAAWRPIAAGANRTSKNLARLAEVLAGFGYRKEAVTTLGEALELDKDNFNLLVSYADLLHLDGQHDEALKQLDAAAKLIGENAEEAETILQAQLKIYQETETLTTRALNLQKQLDATPTASAEMWHRLARYYEAGRQFPEATAAMAKAIERDNTSVQLLTSLARIHESGGNLLAASETFRLLAGIDRRYRTEHLTAVAKLEQRLGRREQAIQAGRDLMAAAPGNPEHHKFFAELCFQLGDPEEGLEALRRSVRANPADPDGLLTLAQALASRQRHGESIELLWRAFEKTETLDAKLGVVERLAEMYLMNNQFDRLTERLERERREADRAREMTLCIAQAYRKAGDLGTARQQLERLLTEHTRDTTLLYQLSQLAEAESDLAAATKYQRQVVASAPNDRDSQLRLAQLLVKTGEGEEAAEIWVKLIAGETEPHRNLQAIDQLTVNSKHDTVLAITARLLAQKPGDWELLYREGAALAALERFDEAKARFQTILEVRLPDDEAGELLKFQRRKKTKAAAAVNPSSTPTGATSMVSFGSTNLRSQYGLTDTPPLMDRINSAWEVRRYTGLELDRFDYVYGQQQQQSWAPRDFGQARMACLAWLLGFAGKDQIQEDFLKSYREAKNRPGTDLRAWWDWYYLQLVRLDYRESFETGRALAQGNDPAGQLALLNSLANRTISNSRYYRPGQNADRAPPLPAEQLDLMVTAYSKLRQQKPDWATSDIVQSVLAELKRAKRSEDEGKLYAEAIASADSIPTVRNALTIASMRGDMANVAVLFDKLDRLQGPPKGNVAQLVTRQFFGQIGMAMVKRADDKAFDDVVKLLDVYLVTMRKQNQAAPKTLASSRSTARVTTSIQYYVSSPTGRANSRSIQVDFPQPNDYFDRGAITLLRTAFEIYKKADLLSDLLAHFRNKIDSAPPTERLYHHLALGYLQWWSDDKEEALSQMTLAAQQIPDDGNLALEVAELRELNNELGPALAMIDAITPPDHNLMQRRERAALRVAERTGNVQRAREAAERLFGLRLDAPTQVELAGKMHRMGMHEMAETVLSRAQRQAGSRSETLVTLMNQYQSQNQAELAAQIARQILRRGPSAQYSPFGMRSEDYQREQAISVLARSGQIKDMIQRVETQLKSSPKSVQLYRTLLEYCKAANDKEKYKATAQKMAELQPEDGRLAYQLAQQLQNLGERQAAIEQYKRAIIKEPIFYVERYYEINEFFQQANKFDELTKLLNEVDFKKAGTNNFYAFTEIMQTLVQNEATRQEGLNLFRKIWDTFKENRFDLLRSFYNEEIWRLPEVYSYVKQGLLPSGDVPVDAWRGAEDIINFGADGKSASVVTRTLEMARRQNRILLLRAEIEEALKTHPEWLAGRAMLIVIDVQTGKADQPAKAWQELLDDPKNPMPPVARCTFAGEIENYSALGDLALKTLESGVEDIVADENMQFNYGPSKRLVRVYAAAGRMDDARKFALRCLNRPMPNHDTQYAAYRRMQDSTAVAAELLAIGEPIEAVRVYSELLADKEMLANANSVGGSRDSQQQAELGLQQAIKALNPTTLPVAARTLLSPRQQPAPGRSVLDLVLFVESRQVQRSTLASMFELAFRAAANTPLRKEAVDKLAELVAAYPNDLGVQSAAALAALIEGRPDAHKAVERLAKLVDAAPLEPLPEKKRANARQRTEAFDQIALWLVARECLKQDSLRPAGEKLATRAAAAARRQSDNIYVNAILREWAQTELDRGNTAGAQARFSEMLEIVLPAALPKQPPAKATSQRTSGANGMAQRASLNDAGSTLAMASPADGVQLAQNFGTLVPVPASGATSVAAPAMAAPQGAPVNTAVVTPEQFNQVIEIARLAAEKKMPDVSMRALREALRAGPPTAAQGNPRLGGRVIVYSASGQMVSTDAAGSVEMSINEMVRLWRREQVPATEIYSVLVDAVMPESRPEEIFLYEGTQAIGPRGIGRLLTKVAIQAGRTDDLRKRVEARGAKPLSELPAKVLLALLAIEANDVAQATECLKGLNERLQKDTQLATTETIAAVAMSGMDRKELAAVCLPILERAAKNFVITPRPDRAQAMLFRVARYHLDSKDEDAARKTFEQAADILSRTPSRSASVEGSQAQSLAQQYLRAGWLAECLGELGKYIDSIPASRSTMAEPSTTALVPLARQLLKLPAEKRYELLKNWTLPTEARRSVRFAFVATPKAAPPAMFGVITRPSGPIITTGGLLIDAAREAGKLDELAAELDKLAQEKVENAETVRLMVAAARGQTASLAAEFKERSAEIVRRATEVTPTLRSTGRQQAQVRWSDFALAQSCLADPRSVAIGEELMRGVLNHAQINHTNAVITEARRALFSLEAQRAGAPEVVRSVGLDRWYNATPNSVWAAQDGHVAHLAADQTSYLLFDCPLAGTFEFSVDAYIGTFTEGNLGYAGLTFEAQKPTSISYVFPVGSHERINRKTEDVRSEDFNRVTIQVEPGKVRCLVNGRLYYEEPDASPTSPWIMLVSQPVRRPAFKNATLTGKPEVLREVQLSQGNSLGGWMAHVHRSQLPTPLTVREPSPGPNTPSYVSMTTAARSGVDWEAKNGELLGRNTDGEGRNSVPSKLAYFRPMKSGDKIRYEFFYEPEVFHVHPSLGRLAFMLEPEGVQLHWLAEGLREDWSGLALDNAINEPEARRGPGKPPLREKAWNAVAISMSGDTLKLELNGESIYERKIEDDNERLFGLFHYRDRSQARVRNVVLSGNWPQQLERPSDVSLAISSATPAEARMRRTLIGEHIFGKSAEDLIRRTKGKSAAERYQMLADWVLPGESHPVFQLAGQFSPGEASETTAGTLQGRRLLLGGRLESPALELIKAAKELDKIDELATRIEKVNITGSSDFDRRCRQAMLAIVRTAQGRDADAEAVLRQIPEEVKKLPIDADGWQRWPEFLTALVASERPALRASALAIFDAQVASLQESVTQKRTFETRDEWIRLVRHARARLQVAMLSAEPGRQFGTEPALANWSPVAWVSAETRGQGRNAPHWMVRDGELWHYPGYQDDCLYLQMPLEGDFELSCELAASGSREARIQYGGLRLDLLDTLKSYELRTFGQAPRKLPIEPPLTGIGDWCKYRLVVKGGSYTVFVNDREICSEPLGVSPDPWLLIYAPHENTATVRNLRITGDPKVPQQIELTRGFDLSAWRPYHAGTPWEKRGEQLYSAGKKPETPEEQTNLRRFPERALHYHRPLIEDGEVEYEFYYDSAKAMVHPVLDRVTFLIEPEGVRIHWLTDGSFDRSGLKYDNVSDEPKNRRGSGKLPLKEKDWNRAKLAVTGDMVTLTVNALEVYQRPIEATNQRLFGLFNYTDVSEAKVRNVTYRGAWPKQAPTIGSLFATAKKDEPRN